MNQLKRARWMLGIVALGLLVSGLTIWPAKWELTTIVWILWGNSEPVGAIHRFILQAIEGIKAVESNYPFLSYGYDWLAFAHIVLAILFAGAMRDPARNIWIVQCGLIMCVLVPILAGVCIPLRGIPLGWFWIDSAFAVGAAIPLGIALYDIKKNAAAITTM